MEAAFAWDVVVLLKILRGLLERRNALELLQHNKRHTTEVMKIMDFLKFIIFLAVSG